MPPVVSMAHIDPGHVHRADSKRLDQIIRDEGLADGAHLLRAAGASEPVLLEPRRGDSVNVHSGSGSRPDRIDVRPRSGEEEVEARRAQRCWEGKGPRMSEMLGRRDGSGGSALELFRVAFYKLMEFIYEIKLYVNFKFIF